jgi:hypothetical protein
MKTVQATQFAVESIALDKEAEHVGYSIGNCTCMRFTVSTPQ